MVRKRASEVKKGDIMIIAGEELEVEEVEISDIGKQGTKKVRIVAKKKSGERVTMVRPDEYPIETK